MGVFELSSGKDKSASAGRYNSIAFKKCAEQKDLFTENVKGDAFLSNVKE
jgi:enoyl-[acyl-carrier protein] reductase/trans-2-enoyl-CoA reductase (NAD+)